MRKTNIASLIGLLISTVLIGIDLYTRLSGGEVNTVLFYSSSVIVFVTFIITVVDFVIFMKNRKKDK